MIRPKSIVNFERLYLGSWLLSMVSLAINWGATREMIAENPGARQFGTGLMMNIVIGALIFSSVITFLLWYFAARQRSVVAKWVLVACFALALFGIPGLIAAFFNGELVTGGLGLIVLLMHTGAIVMLFQRDAREWFGEIKAPPSDSAGLSDTFQ